MRRRKQKRELKLGPPVVFSFICHILAFVVLTQLHVFSSLRIKEAPVYYVDLLNLPVPEPQAGNPSAPTAPSRPQVLVTPQPPLAAPSAMKLPTKPAEKNPVKPPGPTAKEIPKGESSREFDERLARMEKAAEARHAAAALESLQKKAAATAAKGRPGMPGASGKEAGSDYGSFIRSRLEDAFRQEDTFRPDRNKLVAVRIVIGKNGRIARVIFDQLSQDKMFNEAVNRTIRRAENDFKPPPGGGEPELNFVFKPQEVGKR